MGWLKGSSQKEWSLLGIAKIGMNPSYVSLCKVVLIVATFEGEGVEGERKWCLCMCISEKMTILPVSSSSLICYLKSGRQGPQEPSLKGNGKYKEKAKLPF